MRNLGIAALLSFLSLPLMSHADDTVNIQLPPPRQSGSPGVVIDGSVSKPPAKSEAQAFEEYTRKITHGRNLASRGSEGRPRTQSPGAGQSGAEKVVGRLAVIGRGATIRSGRGSSRRALAKVRPGTYIAINSESGSWYGVLMSDRSTGWVAKSDVQVLNYEVVTPKNYDPAPYRDYASNGGSTLLTGGQQAILDYAYQFLGVPYKWGGTSADGLDCSAFVQRCFATQGIQLPRTAHEQIGCGMPINSEELRAGDRVYFASHDGHISHTGIYVGNGYFIHSSSSHHGVAVSNLSDPLYRKMYAGARR